jgi:hypothetical protein
MHKIKLNKIVFKNTTMVRPNHALGSCGFYPKAWQIAPLKKGQSVIDAFLSANHNWTRGEIASE